MRTFAEFKAKQDQNKSKLEPFKQIADPSVLGKTRAVLTLVLSFSLWEDFRLKSLVCSVEETWWLSHYGLQGRDFHELTQMLI